MTSTFTSPICFSAKCHFFIDDYHFERLWQRPGAYLDVLKPYICVLTPDFSLYMDMPDAMQQWNRYRSAALGWYWAQHGITVVPTLCSYFLITRRLMYTCTQQGYRCTQIDFCCNVLTSLAKIAVSLWFPNYVLYFSVTIFFNVTANLLIARRFPTRL